MTEALVNDIIVRPARADDFDFVADLMIRALTPFYDGDPPTRSNLNILNF